MVVPGEWEDIVRRKREERESRLPKEWQVELPAPGVAYNPLMALIESGVLSPQELDWTDPKKSDATATLALLSSGHISAEHLITAFCKRAAAANSLTNFISEVNFTQAIERAKELDRHFRETGKVIGPLHGLPITVKDHMDVKGHDSSAGIASFCFEPATSNSHLVQILVNAGAIVVAKTNIPQTCLASDTISVVFGRTLNAHNSTFGAGGSSGGESSALAMGASLLGLGSDGAGSARMPAMANGVVGYRPSGYRLPADGRAILDPGMIGIAQLGPVATFGLMGHSVRDIRLAAKLVSDSKPWETDPFLYPSPWLGILAPSQPRIGVWADTSAKNYCHLSPPVLRGYLAAQDRLRKAGFNLVEFSPPDLSGVWGLCKDFIHVQGVRNLTREISKEPMMKIVEKTGIFRPGPPPSPLRLDYIHELNGKLARLNIAMSNAWNASGRPLDALLWVTSQNTALPIDEWTDTTFTCVFNAVDWPAISLPLGMQSNKDIDHKFNNFKPFSEEDARLEALYDPDRFHGLPLSVQLMGRKFQDEKLLATAELIHPIIREA